MPSRTSCADPLASRCPGARVATQRLPRAALTATATPSAAPACFGPERLIRHAETLEVSSIDQLVVAVVVVVHDSIVRWTRVSNAAVEVSWCLLALPWDQGTGPGWAYDRVPLAVCPAARAGGAPT